MSSVYQRVISTRFSREEKAIIEDKFDQWEGYEQIVDNIKNEQILPDEYMVSLLKVFLDNTQPDALLGEYEAVCHKNNLKGGRIYPNEPNEDLPVHFGVAINKGTLKSGLMKSPYFKNGLAEVEPFIDGLCPVDMKNDWQNINKEELKDKNGLKLRPENWIVWATWNEDKQGDPFEFCCTNDADEVRACLGLKRDSDSINEDLYLFRFDMPVEATPRIPTITDAAGDMNFRPTGVGSRFGKTYLNRLPQDKGKRYYDKGRPECVHENISLECIKYYKIINKCNETKVY